MQEATVEGQDLGSAAAAAAAAATAGAIAKVAAAEVAGKELSTATSSASSLAADGVAKVSIAESPGTARFFLRGIGNLGEHHLRDYFEKLGEVVEVTLVRDKKTKRPRGMAFVGVAPRADKGTDAPAPSAEDLTDRVTQEAHTINGVVVELQEALPKPEGDETKSAGAAAGSVGGAPAAAAAEQAEAPAEEPAAVLDPAAQAQAQAQWQMHYLALAINASVPEVSQRPAATGGGGAAAPGGGGGVRTRGPGLQTKAGQPQKKSSGGFGPARDRVPPRGVRAGGAPY